MNRVALIVLLVFVFISFSIKKPFRYAVKLE